MRYDHFGSTFSIMQNNSFNNESFDFDQHREAAIRRYRFVKGLYEEFAEVLRHILGEALAAASVKIHSIEARAKSIESFGKKASRPSNSDPSLPQYRDPLSEITDLAGVRVISFFPKTLKDVDRVIKSEFTVLKKKDKRHYQRTKKMFGYRSIHYLIRMKQERSILPEYKCFAKLTAEVQVRTILQHAWAEMEHDIRYKSADIIPTSIRRRFEALARTIEIADREFQEIQNEDKKLQRKTIRSVQAGKFKDARIIPDALKYYMDQRFGPDGRMTEFSYEAAVALLKKMGFSNIKQLDDCIKNYDHDSISKVLWGFRQGQIRRLEDTLLAAMGKQYITHHPLSADKEFSQRCSQSLKKLKKNNIPIGIYVPAKSKT
jgi:putative GTP pyrophosphokinase